MRHVFNRAKAFMRSEKIQRVVEHAMAIIFGLGVGAVLWTVFRDMAQ